jgi:hypothetical protein
MKKIIKLTAWIHILFSPVLFAQSGFWNSKYAYLGQTPPGDTPVVFASGKLAAPGYWAGSRVVFTRDGKEFLYGTNTTWFDGTNQKLISYRFDGRSWKGPNFIFKYFSMPTLAIDGKTILLTGNDGSIYQTYFSDTGWVNPIEFLNRSYPLYNFMPTNTGHCYVGSSGTWGKPSDYNSWKFAILAGTGSDTSIQSLGEPLNSPGAFNGDFCIAPDESYMIISAKETSTFECELYISFRKADHGWSAPVSLGPLINDGLAHRWGPYVSPDEKYLFYTRGTSEKDCAIYWVRFDHLLKKLKAAAATKG